MHAVIQHRRQRLVAGGTGDEVLADDDERDARGSDVLLRAGVDEAVLRDVDRAAEDVGRVVADQRHVADVGQRAVFRALDRVVRGHVHVGRARRELQLGLLRQARVVLALRGRRHVDGADLLRFLDRLVGPGAAVDVVGRLARRRAGSSAPSRTAGWRRPAGTAPCSSTGCSPACGCPLRPARGSPRRPSSDG